VKIDVRGGVRTVTADELVFDEVTNPGEVYSNYSGTPEYRTHRIKLVDVVNSRLY